MARKLRDALPAGDRTLRASVWDFMRPMLSPALTALNRDTFINDEYDETTVDLDAHHAASDLDELDLGDAAGVRIRLATPQVPVLPSEHQAPAGGQGRGPLFFFARLVDPAR